MMFTETCLTILLLSAAQVFVSDSSSLQPPETAKDKQVMTLVIDPGHGGYDSGCVVPGLHEKVIALAFSRRLGQKITELDPNIHIIYTRTDDAAVPLQQRTAYGNQIQADAFVSIHCNAHHESVVKGFETYVYGEQAVECGHNHEEHASETTNNLSGPNAILSNLHQQKARTESIELAQHIQRGISRQALINNRGVKQGRFRVLKYSQVPSVLLEIGYLTNPSDRYNLQRNSYQNRLADQLAQSIIAYLRQESV